MRNGIVTPSITHYKKLPSDAINLLASIIAHSQLIVRIPDILLPEAITWQKDNQ
jgi:hypothetical protein